MAANSTLPVVRSCPSPHNPVYTSHFSNPPRKHRMKAFEIFNPSFNDIPLADQIAHGINDWCVQGVSGHEYYGRTAAEALEICAAHLDNR